MDISGRAAQVKLVVGLGNPGWRYKGTRHNIGFRALEILAKRLPGVDGTWERLSQYDVLTTFGEYNSQGVILAKPTTFMNHSGVAVAPLAEHHGVAATDIIVVHDDKDIALGAIKVQRNRGHGGHNGIKSLIAELGTQDFYRIRVGVASDDVEQMKDAVRFVLGRFSWREKRRAKHAMHEAADLILGLL
jgi:PTH1 family peptidyl-tRNA hydrolase